MAVENSTKKKKVSLQVFQSTTANVKKVVESL